MLHTRPAPAPAPPEATRQTPPHGPEATLETLRRLGQDAGNRALARRLILREPAVDTRPLELSGGLDSSGRTYRRSEMVRTDAGDPARGRAASMEEVYWVEFKVNGDGVMTASARTVSPDRTARSAHPQARHGVRRGAQGLQGQGGRCQGVRRRVVVHERQGDVDQPRGVPERGQGREDARAGGPQDAVGGVSDKAKDAVNSDRN